VRFTKAKLSSRYQSSSEVARNTKHSTRKQASTMMMKSGAKITPLAGAKRDSDLASNASVKQIMVPAAAAVAGPAAAAEGESNTTPTVSTTGAKKQGLDPRAIAVFPNSGGVHSHNGSYTFIPDMPTSYSLKHHFHSNLKGGKKEKEFEVLQCKAKPTTDPTRLFFLPGGQATNWP
jgi:hypothetical protein